MKRPYQIAAGRAVQRVRQWAESQNPAVQLVLPMVEILALVLTYDEQAVLAAVELALEAGAPSKPHVLNLLARLTGETPPAPIAAPPALALKIAPEANVARYDALRGGRHVA